MADLLAARVAYYQSPAYRAACAEQDALSRQYDDALTDHLITVTLHALRDASTP